MAEKTGIELGAFLYNFNLFLNLNSTAPVLANIVLPQYSFVHPSFLPKALSFLNCDHQLSLQLLSGSVRRQVQSIEARVRTRQHCLFAHPFDAELLGSIAADQLLESTNGNPTRASHELQQPRFLLPVQVPHERPKPLHLANETTTVKLG